MKNSIKINGKIYKKTIGFSTKIEAQSIARKRRKKGLLIRVIRHISNRGNGIKYYLYQRVK
mgnify:CR=1 FL=1